MAGRTPTAVTSVTRTALTAFPQPSVAGDFHEGHRGDVEVLTVRREVFDVGHSYFPAGVVVEVMPVMAGGAGRSDGSRRYF